MKKKIHLRPLRCIGGLIFLMAVIFLFFFLRSYLLLSVVVLMVAWPVLSVAGLWYLSGKLQVTMSAGQSQACPGDTILLAFQIINHSWWPALDAEWKLRIENTFWEERSDRSISMPVRIHGKEALTMPLRITSLGRFCVSCDTLLLQDIMGLARVSIPLGLSMEFDVIPPSGSEREESAEGYLSGVSETEESREKGNDFAEVSDIREYQPGDRIRDIHWKLSAKKDVLMVKERVAVAGSEMVVMLQLGTDKEMAEQILVRVFHLCQEFLRLHVPVCLILWNQSEYGWEECRFGAMGEMADVWHRIYQLPVSLRHNAEWEVHMRNCYPSLGTYLTAEARDGEIQVVVHENA